MGARGQWVADIFFTIVVTGAGDVGDGAGGCCWYGAVARRVGYISGVIDRVDGNIFGCLLRDPLVRAEGRTGCAGLKGAV